MSLLLWLACGADEGALEDMLTAGSSLDECAGVEVGQLQTLCYVEVAAAAGAHQDDATAKAACAEIDEGVWREECHFRAGEELAKAGLTDLALRHCVVAGQFAPFCLTHSFWGLSMGRELSSDDPDAVISAMDEFLVTVDAALADADPMLRAEARDGLLSRAWFNVYVGTGLADPAAAKAAPADQAPYARTAWAMEAARLMDLDEPALAVPWMMRAYAADQVLTGLEQAPEARVGQHARPLFPSEHHGVAAIFIFGGGRRLVDPDPMNDLVIACMEGLFYAERDLKSWSIYLTDENFAVRQTAVKNTVLAGGEVRTDDALDQEMSRVAKKERRGVIRRQRPPPPKKSP